MTYNVFGGTLNSSLPTYSNTVTIATSDIYIYVLHMYIYIIQLM